MGVLEPRSTLTSSYITIVTILTGRSALTVLLCERDSKKDDDDDDDDGHDDDDDHDHDHKHVDVQDDD